MSAFCNKEVLSSWAKPQVKVAAARPKHNKRKFFFMFLNF